MSHHHRPTGRALGLLLAAALLAAACATDNAANTPPAENPEPPVSETAVAGEPALAFAQCLRDRGLDVADPAPGETVVIQGVDADDPATQAVVQDCAQRHLAGGEARVSVGGSMGENLADLENLIRFVDCMRDNGIDMADPDPDGRLPLPENVAPDSLEFRSALDQCARHLEGGRVLIGQGGSGGTAGRTP
jgi:hypothetical protein